MANGFPVYYRVLGPMKAKMNFDTIECKHKFGTLSYLVIRIFGPKYILPSYISVLYTSHTIYPFYSLKYSYHIVHLFAL